MRLSFPATAVDDPQEAITGVSRWMRYINSRTEESKDFPYKAIASNYLVHLMIVFWKGGQCELKEEPRRQPHNLWLKIVKVQLNLYLSNNDLINTITEEISGGTLQGPS